MPTSESAPARKDDGAPAWRNRGVVPLVRGWVAAPRRHPRRTVAVLSGAAFAIGAAIALRTGSMLAYADEHDYVKLARHLADGLGFTTNGRTPTAFRPPAWPAVISVVDLVGGGVTATRLVNVAFFSLTVVALYSLIRRIAGTDAGLLAAAVLTVYPLSLYTATTLYPEAQAMLLVTLGLLAAVIANDAEVLRVRVGSAAAAGACFGLLGLTAPTYLVVAFAAVIWLLWRRFSLRRIASLAVPLAFVTIIPLGMWGLRNEAQLGAFVPLTTNGGYNLLLGNNPNATPTTGVDADISKYLESARRRGLDEVDRDRYFREQAIDWIKNNPTSAATLYAGKLANFFNYRSNLVTKDQQSGLTDLLGAVTFYPLLVLLALRLAAFRKLPLLRGEGLLALSYMFCTLAGALFTTRIRYRVPVDQLMIGVIACGIVAWWRSRQRSASSMIGDKSAA